jgi:hypothetical protein
MDSFGLRHGKRARLTKWILLGCAMLLLVSFNFSQSWLIFQSSLQALVSELAVITRRESTQVSSDEWATMQRKVSTVSCTLQPNVSYSEVLSWYSSCRRRQSGIVAFYCPFHRNLSCGGLADEFRGIIPIFNLAVVLNMKFCIQPTHGFVSGGNGFVPNLVDWTCSMEEINQHCPVSLGIRAITEFTLSNATYGTRGHSLCIYSNSIFNPSKVALPKYFQDSPALSPSEQIQRANRARAIHPFFHNVKRSNMYLFEHFPDAFFHSFHHLFKPHPDILKSVEESKIKMGFDRFKHIIALHFRERRNELDKRRKYTSDHILQRMVNCALDIEKEKKWETNTTGWYISSDRPFSSKQKFLHPFRSKLLSMYDASQNSSHAGHIAKSDNPNAGFYTIRDMYLFADKQIQVIVFLDGHFSAMAAVISKKDYKYCHSKRGPLKSFKI